MTLSRLRLQGFQIFNYFFCKNLTVRLVRRWLRWLLSALATQVSLYFFQTILRKGGLRRSLDFFWILRDLICDLRLIIFLICCIYEIHIYINHWIISNVNILMFFFKFLCKMFFQSSFRPINFSHSFSLINSHLILKHQPLYLRFCQD